MMTLYHSPGSCSDGIVLLLNEVGATYDIQVVDVRKGQQFESGFKAKNPKGKVPALALDDGTVLTEFQSIAFWIANQFPDAGLWPKDLASQQDTLATLDHIVGSVHMRGFTFVKVPQKFQLDDKGTEDLRAYGRTEVDKGLAHMSEKLGKSDYMLGDFSIADGAAYYVLKWAEEEGFEIPTNLAGLLKRLRSRPSLAA